jgi:chemotaxis signal transduction protein
MSDLFARLRRSVAALEAAIAESDEAGRAPPPHVLDARTDRISREPERIEAASDAAACLLFERSGRRYGAPLAALSAVGSLGPVAHVPGVPEAFLGVAARRGRIVSVIDLPRLFGAPAATTRPGWLLMAASQEVVCGVCADELHDVVEVQKAQLGRAMPTFSALLSRHTLGVLEDGTVILDLVELLQDRSLRVEERPS